MLYMDLRKAFTPGERVYFVGIKGTGMCALAELLYNSGVLVSGSDKSEVFYTDAILKKLGIPYYEDFDSAHVDKNNPPVLIIHSAAYRAETNPEMAEALKLGIPLCKYSDALGAYSAIFDSSGIAGVHGKTTTTALAGCMIRGAGLPAKVLAGSAVSSFNGQSTLSLGDTYFVAETCEYRRHFLAFHPRRIILTSVEHDHQDFFPDYESILNAFLDYCRRLPPGGELFYCADDSGACEAAALMERENRSLRIIPYGFASSGEAGIESYEVKNECIVMKVRSFPEELRIRVPGRHTACNAAAALALTSSLVKNEAAGRGGSKSGGWTAGQRKGLVEALEGFRGSRRRAEIIGEAGGILFMDDYGHHPTAIRKTLAGLKEFYPSRRIILSFMSHTYTRTAALLDEFAASFTDADYVLLHKIYASAREAYSGGVTGRTLFDKAREIFGDKIFYIEEPGDAADLAVKLLRGGDLFITMGAGDNWKLGRKLICLMTEQISLLSEQTKG
jgi:UDP-N-acetylmuramate--alanine ligase